MGAAAFQLTSVAVRIGSIRGGTRRWSNAMMDHPEPKLAGKRVLLVEDSYLAATSIAQMLEDIGCHVVGPFATVDDAMGAVDAGGFDAGVLDVNLGKTTSEPVASDLMRRGVPFVFVTGYLSPALRDPKFAAYARVHKPLTEAMLSDALMASLEGE